MTVSQRARRPDPVTEPPLGPGYEHLTAAYPELTSGEIHEALIGAVRRKQAAAAKLHQLNRRADLAAPIRITESTTVWVVDAESTYHISSQCSAITSYSGVEKEPMPIIRALADKRGLELCRWCRAWTEA